MEVVDTDRWQSNDEMFPKVTGHLLQREKFRNKEKKWKRQANSRRPFSYQENLQRGNTEMVWAHVEIIKAFQDTPAINYKSWDWFEAERRLLTVRET